MTANLYYTFLILFLPRFYGCGLTIPSHIEGCRILDLGSGSGQDCFALSKLVGPKGSVVGLDMTDKQVITVYNYGAQQPRQIRPTCENQSVRFQVGNSGVATGGGGARGQSATPDSEKFAKDRKKEGKIGKKEEKSGKKGKSREGSFTLPFLTDRAGYASGWQRRQTCQNDLGSSTL